MLSGSLRGIRILDFTRLYPGPLCTLMLSDMGADVIKIESPEGELARYLPPYQYGSGATFLQLNRGKKSLTLNLKNDSAVQIAKKLLKKSDVLVESFRPGVMKNFGLDYDTLREDFPALIYCSISGYGKDGPLAKKPGHDLNYISIAGIISLTGHEKRGYVIPPVQIADVLGGFQASTAICAALVEKFRNGTGQHLDISLLDGAFFAMLNLAAIHLAGFPLQASTLPLSGRLACYNIYRTADDRYLAIAFLEPKFWQMFCSKMKLDRFFNHQLQNDQSELTQVLTEKIASKSLNEWLEFFQEEDLCVTPVKDFPATLQDPQILHRHLMIDVSYPSGTLSQMKTPFVQEPVSSRRAPSLGENNLEVLSEIGYSTDEIEALKAEGII